MFIKDHYSVFSTNCSLFLQTQGNINFGKMSLCHNLSPMKGGTLEVFLGDAEDIRHTNILGTFYFLAILITYIVSKQCLSEALLFGTYFGFNHFLVGTPVYYVITQLGSHEQRSRVSKGLYLVTLFPQYLSPDLMTHLCSVLC